MRRVHVNQRPHNPKGDKARVYETGRKDNRYERRQNPQRNWCVVVYVHVLGYSKTVLSLDVAKYDQGSTATAVET